MLNEMQENISLVSFSSRLASQVQQKFPALGVTLAHSFWITGH